MPASNFMVKIVVIANGCRLVVGYHISVMH